jgi:hypothetical protein
MRSTISYRMFVLFVSLCLIVVCSRGMCSNQRKRKKEKNRRAQKKESRTKRRENPKETGGT